jgi:hypothetical protein
MDVVRVSEILVLMVLPAVAVEAMLRLPSGVRTARRLVTERTADPTLQPSHPPIEMLAADLQRLLERHEATRRSPGVAMRGRHLRALEGAITDCATEAALALGLPCPERPVHGALALPELRQLLHAIESAGLMLPPAIGLLAA